MTEHDESIPLSEHLAEVDRVRSEARAGALDVTLREAAVELRRAAVKAGAYIVVTNDYADGVKAFGILCDAIDKMDAALDRAILAERQP